MVLLGVRGAACVALLSLLWATPGAVAAPEHSTCELCMAAVHQVQYGQLPACGGDPKAAAFSACSQVVHSMLALAHDLMHLISYGCYKYSPYHGWQTVQPCPAHVLCGRLYNIYDPERKPHCPTDFHYRFPFALGRTEGVETAANPLLDFNQGLRGSSGSSAVLEPARSADTEEASSALPPPEARSSLGAPVQQTPPQPARESLSTLLKQMIQDVLVESEESGVNRG